MVEESSNTSQQKRKIDEIDSIEVETKNKAKKLNPTENFEEKKTEKQMKIIMGTMEFGRKVDQKMSEEIVEMVRSYGHEEFDSALIYGAGNTEKMIGKMPDTLRKHMLISTKANPWREGGLQPENVLRQAKLSLESLGAKQVDIFYLHAPDHKVEIKDTLKAVQQLYQDGVFKRFGLSNYAAWQVVEIYYICKENNWVLPTVYQGMFNVITRDIYRELIPTLRRLKIAFYAYNPLAGGILTGKYEFSDQDDKKPSGRFFGKNNNLAVSYRARFWNKNTFGGVKTIQEALKIAYPDNSVSITEACFRWIIHHSHLDSKFGDGIIIGASSMKHLTENLEACKQGPLDSQVVKAMDQAWENNRLNCPSYLR